MDTKCLTYLTRQFWPGENVFDFFVCRINREPSIVKHCENTSDT